MSGLDVSEASTAFQRQPERSTEEFPRYARFAWAVLAYTLAVILFGAWVRITGSGDGCGNNWPSCHGQMILRSDRLDTLIEYTHRVSSGLLGPMVLVLCVWAWFGAGRRRVVGWWASATVLFTLIEALIGALLVRDQLVADDDSVARAVVVALHLSNTLLLTAALALTAWFGAGRSWPGLALRFGSSSAWLFLGLLAVVLVSMTGAVTALGDTLFPVSPTQGGGLLARLRDDLDAGAHFLVRLRIVHPLLAIGVGIAVGYGSSRLMVGSGESGRLARWCTWAVWLQLAVGALNIGLGAPGWMQLLHLFFAQLLWVLLLLLFFSVRAGEERSVGHTG